jgi:cytochrome c peroxidase
MLVKWPEFFLAILISLSTVSADELDSMKEEFKRPQSIPYPDHNKFTHEKNELGKKLFFDPRLSGSKWISCATCHNPGLGFEDGLPLGLGHNMKKLGRHTPTILNLAWATAFMWDGREESLESQALGPIESHEEMNLDVKQLVKDLKNIDGYKKSFAKAFPKTGLTKENIAKAIATFERGIVSKKAPFDYWIEGKEDAISAKAKRGFKVFNDKANCIACHSSWRFTDDSFHDIGLKSKDIGIGKFNKDNEFLQFAKKTPGLRDIAKRAPYMHDGSKRTLREVIELYNRGGDVKRKSLSDDIEPLGLTKNEIEELEEFLKTLSSPGLKIAFPELPQ